MFLSYKISKMSMVQKVYRESLDSDPGLLSEKHVWFLIAMLSWDSLGLRVLKKCFCPTKFQKCPLCKKEASDANIWFDLKPFWECEALFPVSSHRKSPKTGRFSFVEIGWNGNLQFYSIQKSQNVVVTVFWNGRFEPSFSRLWKTFNEFA